MKLSVTVNRIDWKRDGLSRGAGIPPVVVALAKVAEGINDDAVADVEAGHGTRRTGTAAPVGAYRDGAQVRVLRRRAGYAVARAENTSRIAHLVEYGTPGIRRTKADASRGIMPAMYPLKRSSGKRRRV